MSNILKAKTIQEAVQEAKGTINLERSDAVTGLYCRWNALNRAMLKHWRFATNNVIAGMSGSGKSAALNMIEQDFASTMLNPAFEGKIMLLCFKYEMSASDEILRSLSGKIKKSYAYIISSESEKGSKVYNKVSDDEFLKMEQILSTFEGLPILFFEIAGDLNQMYMTVKHYQEKYPDNKLVVTLDHTLLSKKLSEKDDMELIANTAHVSIRIRKDIGSMNIFVSQMNAEIEKMARKDNPQFHYPVKSDIHGSNQLFWACDSVAVFHRPAQIGLTKYGVNMYDTVIKLPDGSTRDLIHYLIIKGRKNKMGNIWMVEKFNEGGLEEVNPSKPTLFGT